MSENQVVVYENQLSLGVLRSAGPAEVITQATAIATELARLIDNRQLYSKISGRRYVRVEGWTTLGAMLGVLPREDQVIRYEDGTYEATVSLIRVNDGAVIGRGSAICGIDEATWQKRPEYARRSMAVTRATGKAFRLGFSWIMTLAGYEPTPAEEVTDGELETSRHSAPEPKAEPHWVTLEPRRRAFWAWVHDQGLTDHDVHKALGVEHLEQYAGTPGDARNAILAWVKAQAEVGTAEGVPAPVAEEGI